MRQQDPGDNDPRVGTRPTTPPGTLHLTPHHTPTLLPASQPAAHITTTTPAPRVVWPSLLPIDLQDIFITSLSLPLWPTQLILFFPSAISTCLPMNRCGKVFHSVLPSYDTTILVASIGYSRWLLILIHTTIFNWLFWLLFYHKSNLSLWHSKGENLIFGKLEDYFSLQTIPGNKSRRCN